MDAPILNNDQCSLLIAEFLTGIVYTKDLAISFNAQDEKAVFQIFDNMQLAEDFAWKLIAERPEFECAIYNQHGVCTLIIDKLGRRKPENYPYRMNCFPSEDVNSKKE